MALGSLPNGLLMFWLPSYWQWKTAAVKLGSGLWMVCSDRGIKWHVLHLLSTSSEPFLVSKVLRYLP